MRVPVPSLLGWNPVTLPLGRGGISHLPPVVTMGDLTVLHFVAQFLDGGQVAADPVQPIDVQTWQRMVVEMGGGKLLVNHNPPWDVTPATIKGAPGTHMSPVSPGRCPQPGGTQ